MLQPWAHQCGHPRQPPSLPVAGPAGTPALLCPLTWLCHGDPLSVVSRSRPSVPFAARPSLLPQQWAFGPEVLPGTVRSSL